MDDSVLRDTLINGRLSYVKDRPSFPGSPLGAPTSCFLTYCMGYSSMLAKVSCKPNTIHIP